MPTLFLYILLPERVKEGGYREREKNSSDGNIVKGSYLLMLFREGDPINVDSRWSLVRFFSLSLLPLYTAVLLPFVMSTLSC